MSKTIINILQNEWTEGILFWLALLMVLPSIPSNEEPVKYFGISVLIFAASQLSGYLRHAKNRILIAMNITIFFIFSYTLVRIANILLKTS